MDVAREFGVEAVRVPVQDGLPDCSWLASAQQEFFKDVIKESVAASDIFKRNNMR